MSFAAPIFLIAALAAAIPVVLHMINRQRAKDLPFSTLRFLHVSVQKTRRRKRVHDVLLMAMRAAVLLLIAAGLSRPAITMLSTLWGSSNSTAVIILDNSASMSMIDQDKPRFDTALSAAAKILDELKDGDETALFATGGPVYPELGKLYRTQEQIRQLLAQLHVSYERADLAGRLHQARELLAKSESPNKQIYVITDMQKISWENLKNPSQSSLDNGTVKIEELDNSKAQILDNKSSLSLDEPAQQIPIIMIDCNRTPKPNVAIQGLQLEAEVPIAGMPMKASVELFNTSLVAQQRVVELYVDGNLEMSSPELDISPEARTKHDFVFIFKNAGLHRGEVRLVGEDGSKYDDRRFFTKQIDQNIPVAVVKAQQHEIAYLDDAFYLENALSAGQSGDWAIRTKTLLSKNLMSEQLSKYKVIYCVNLPALPSDVAEKLRNYAAEGGNLVWIAGDNVDAQAYNQMNKQSGGRLLPSELKDVRTPAAEDNRDSWHIAFLDKQFAALARLTEPASLYESVLIYKHLRMINVENSGARVLARLDDDEPLLVMRNEGQGKVLMLGAGVQAAWTNLPLRPIFLPLITRLTFELAGTEQSQHAIFAGAPLILKFENARQPISVEVLTPLGETMRLSTKPMEDNKGQVFSYADTHEIGIYVLRLLDAGRETVIAYAVNPDPEEAEPAKIERNELRKSLGNTPLIFAENPDDLSGTFALLREGKSLWGLFLSAVLIVLVFETFVSNKLSTQ